MAFHVYSAHSNAWHLVQECAYAQRLVQEVNSAMISQHGSAGVLTQVIAGMAHQQLPAKGPFLQRSAGLGLHADHHPPCHNSNSLHWQAFTPLCRCENRWYTSKVLLDCGELLCCRQLPLSLFQLG